MGSRAHPATYAKGTGVISREKHPRHEVNHSPPSGDELRNGGVVSLRLLYTFVAQGTFYLLAYKGSRVQFLMVSLEFFIDTILPAALWSWGSTQPLTEMSTRNISCGVKAAGA